MIGLERTHATVCQFFPHLEDVDLYLAAILFNALAALSNEGRAHVLTFLRFPPSVPTGEPVHEYAKRIKERDDAADQRWTSGEGKRST